MAGLLGRRYRVLVADDDAGCRDSMISLLTREGFRTLSVGGGRQAWQRIVQLRALQKPRVRIIREGSRRRQRREMRVETIDFMVLDYNMPDLSGLEVLRRMHVELKLTLPSILVTGEFSQELERTVQAAGGFALVPKPVRLSDFRELVWELVVSQLEGWRGR